MNCQAIAAGQERYEFMWYGATHKGAIRQKQPPKRQLCQFGHVSVSREDLTRLAEQVMDRWTQAL